MIKALHILITSAFLIVNASSVGQRRNITSHYGNGNIYAKGKVLTCPAYNDKYPCIDSTCRKTGKWIYYYQNGNIKRTENYKKIKQCSSDEVPEGIWKYFSEQGTLIKEDEYRNGILWTSDVAEFFENDQPAGVIQVRNGIRDTIFRNEPDGSNLILNGEFNLYFGPPHPQTRNGQEEIGKQIPFWVSADKITPDYYNQFRRLINVPDNLDHSHNEKYNYTGIILYHDPTKNYSEYITGKLSSKLEPDQNYCIRIRIRLSRNSGFYINKLDVGFSDDVNDPGFSNPQISFNQKLNNRDGWITICALYTASGNENYITLGRCDNLNETLVTPIAPLNLSTGDFNQSAYYIIDSVELMEDTTDCNCTFEGYDSEFTF